MNTIRSSLKKGLIYISLNYILLCLSGVFIMDDHVTIMVNGTIYDMFGEFYYFVSEVYPELREFCQNHGIELEFKDVSFSA